MKLKFFYCCLFAAMLFPISLAAQTQSPKWVFANYLANFTGPAPTLPLLPTWSSCGSYAANVALDHSGNLLFYIEWMLIYDAAGNEIGYLDGGEYSETKEVAVFEVPGHCHQYYIVYAKQNNLYYTKVVDGPNGIEIVSGQSNVNCTGSASFTGNIQIAVSRLRPDNARILYATGDENLCKYIITSQGISFSQLMLSSTTSPTMGMNFASNELDLSHAGDQLAWGNHSGFFRDCNAYVIDLNANGNYVGHQTYTIPESGTVVGGVEFDATGNSLYVSSTWSGAGPSPLHKGINVIDLTQAPTSFTYLGGSSYGVSQLEMAFDGKIYAASPSSSKIGSIDPNTNIFTLNAINISCNQMLPDQIDGQDYLLAVGPPDFWVSDGTDTWSSLPQQPVDNGAEPQPAIYWDGAIWNCENDPNCPQNENPEFKMFGDNYMRVKVRNNGCVNSAPTTADLHMYWTRGRSGEIWDAHWLDPILRPLNTINGFAAGGEITADQVTANSIPIDIPAIPAGGEVILTQAWRPPYPGNFTGDGFDVDSNQNPMICFLARIESGIDPIVNEQFGPIGENVKNSNNIATRNTYLVNLDPLNIAHWGGSLGLNLQYDAPAVVRLDFTASPLNEPFAEFGTVNLQFSTSLWNLWMDAGAQAENVEIVDFDQRIVQVTDPQHASVRGLGLQPDRDYSILPGFRLNNGAEGEHSFQFRINMVDEETGEYGSTNTYEVRIGTECNINLLNEFVVTPGNCTTIGQEMGCTDCKYTWSPANGLANPSSPVTTACPDQTTTYRLTVTNEATGCQATDNVTVHVEDRFQNRSSEKFIAETRGSVHSGVQVFPNPANDLFQITFKAREAKYLPLVLINSLGQIFVRQNVQVVKGQNTFSLSAKQLPQGLYHLRIGNGDWQGKSIVIEH